MLTIITAAIAPAVALLSFFYLKDDFEQEPVYLVVRSFIFGAILVFPILFIQYVLSVEAPTSSVIIDTFFYVAFTEEFFKWFILLITIFFHAEFNQRYDGIVYATAVGLGFASVENIFYIATNGLDTAIFRAIFPVTSHALFGVVMGYYFGLAKFHAKRRIFYLALAFIIPYLLHSSYNFILVSVNRWIYLLVPFMIFLWIFAMRKVKKANAHLMY
ncbi:intramembrane metalloprotease PrsW [Paenalkalicoccus suaedae]|uniref:Protease PrsW n=1 Tax=Paenalkalicoccus suaedae TaxID=2592382 RepID=A0A859FCV9_9BACI|nr:glutamic-type intramembrane protease PrsW [Paenalkalicoccus suaedae]QKS71069.1 intramembrane metalloprotease PrsW [Paenalkalicoccus suaedae]